MDPLILFSLLNDFFKYVKTFVCFFLVVHVIYGMNKNVGLLINSSRGIIYASNQLDFAKAAANKANNLQQQMKVMLNKFS